jgi:hypothetical protein
MGRVFSVFFVSLILGCALTPTVNTRKPGEPWTYYGDLTGVYRDQTNRAPVALVWLEQVLFTRTQRADFQKTLQGLLKQGYKKIGIVIVQNPYFVDPYEAKKLAADKGANLVLGCWFAAGRTSGQRELVEYWYQFLYKATPAPVPAPIPIPAITPPPSVTERQGQYGNEPASSPIPTPFPAITPPPSGTERQGQYGN